MPELRFKGYNKIMPQDCNIKKFSGCIVCDDAGGVLVLHCKTPECSQWEIPEVEVAPGETAEQAAARAMQENLSIGVRIVDLLGSRNSSEGHHTWFLAEATAGEPVLFEHRQYDKFGFLSLITLTRRYDELAANTKTFLEAMAYGEIKLDI